MNFNFIQTDKKLPEFPAFYKNIKHDPVVLAFDNQSGVVIESDEYVIGIYRKNWHNFKDTNMWTRISGKIEL